MSIDLIPCPGKGFKGFLILHFFHQHIIRPISRHHKNTNLGLCKQSRNPRQNPNQRKIKLSLNPKSFPPIFSLQGMLRHILRNTNQRNLLIRLPYKAEFFRQINFLFIRNPAYGKIPFHPFQLHTLSPKKSPVRSLSDCKRGNLNII